MCLNRHVVSPAGRTRLLWPAETAVRFTPAGEGGMQEASGGPDEGERAQDQRMP